MLCLRKFPASVAPLPMPKNDAPAMQSVSTPPDAVARLQELVRAQQPSQALLLVDETVSRHPRHAPGLDSLGCPRLELVAEETRKTLDQAQAVWDFLHAQAADRHALVAVVGGGLVLDLGAFAAATWKRGTPFVLVPTTLLAMVDAAIGGKTAVNFRGGKNLLGSFSLPLETVISAEWLASLPPRELRAGFAEVLKHALIADADYWQQLQAAPLAEQHWPEVIRRSVAIKQDIVAADPNEQGSRKLLNFGHTIGHALESLSHRSAQPLLHGEAVGLGMLAEAWLSVEHAGLPSSEAAAIERALARFGLLPPLPAFDEASLQSLLRQDKKNARHELRFSLLRQIGHGVYDVNVPMPAVQPVLERLRSSAGSAAP